MAKSAHTTLQDMAGGFSVFTSRLREAKHKSMLTLQDISDKTGLSISTVKKMFSGEAVNPSVYNVAAVCKLLGVSLDELLGLSAQNEETEDAEHLRNALHAREEQVTQLRHFVYVLVGVLCFALLIIAYLVTDALHPDWGFFRR